MILRRYGDALRSVEIHFDSRAMEEVGFRRDHSFSTEAERFFDTHEKVEERELATRSEGPVQDEGEAELLAELERRLRSLEEEVGEDAVLVVENPPDEWPKTRDLKKNVVVDGENRLYFFWRVEPPLRIGVYRESTG